MSHYLYHSVILSVPNSHQLDVVTQELDKRELEYAVSRKTVNQTYSVCVFPSGSKAGWDEWREHARKIQAFVANLKIYSPPVEWTWVCFGDDVNNRAYADIHDFHGNPNAAPEPQQAGLAVVTETRYE